MFSKLSNCNLFLAASLLALTPIVTVAQNTEPKAPPVLDVHVHAMDGIPASVPCVQTLRSSPRPIQKRKKNRSAG